MGYVVYEKATTVTWGKVYKTHAAAQAAITRASNKWYHAVYKPGFPYPPLSEDPVYLNGIAEEEYFRKNVEKHRKVVNMMTGAETMEPVNTPNYMSVGSESYWSM